MYKSRSFNLLFSYKFIHKPLHLVKNYRTFTTSRMNVLVYSDQGTTKESVRHCLETFRLLLSPYYSVATVQASTLIKQPWEAKTTALIIPGGADLPLCQLLNGEPNEKIRKFVRKGGKFIGLCSGGYYASARCEFEVGNPNMEVSGPRELGFFPGTCRGCVHKGFVYGSEIGAQAVDMSVDRQKLPSYPQPMVTSYYNGGGMFVDAQKYENTQILARYKGAIDVKDGPEGQNASVILCKVGKGYALLSGAHPEFSPDLLHANKDQPEFAQVIKKLKKSNSNRLAFLRACLKKLGLKVNASHISERPSLTPLFVTSANPASASELGTKLENELDTEIGHIMNGGSDRFRLHQSLSELTNIEHRNGYEDPELAIKDIFFCGDRYPDQKVTPHFDFETYFRALDQEYKYLGTTGQVGKNLMYGDVLTSTSVLMDSNIHFMRNLPDGFTVHGAIQVCGKGRSGNYWVNPRGVFATSVLKKLPVSRGQTSSPIVFIQYISSMALIEAIWKYGDGYSEIPLGIKWPNDIYIMLPKFIGQNVTSRPMKSDGALEATYTKIGGIMVNVNVLDNQYYLVVGSGLNVSNAAPTTSVNMVIEVMNKYRKDHGIAKHLDPVCMERVLANYLAIFNSMINIFESEGFSPFLDKYYQMWFHTNQIVHVLQKNNAKAQIVGITPDWGMLLVREIDANNEPTGTMYELQPDGNSFDMFRGLISKKK